MNQQELNCLYNTCGLFGFTGHGVFWGSAEAFARIFSFRHRRRNGAYMFTLDKI